MQNEFIEYKRQILEKHDLSVPDHRPLYRYRVTDEEFNTLEQLLKDKIAVYMTVAELGDIASEVIGFPALFVLYASEWWRRRYDGSGWSWEPIMQDLCVPTDSWNPTQRSRCVTTGLMEWSVELNANAGYRYLGTIALQGGLPMRLLAQAHGNIGRVLMDVLSLAAGGATHADIKGWVGSLGNHLPRTYRQDEIYSLLADVIYTVLQLKVDANLDDAETAIAVLDRKMAGWRDRFPLPIDVSQAQGLIDRLIKGVVTVSRVRTSLILPVERSLEQLEPEVWQIQSKLELPESIQVESLAKLFGLSSDELPRFGELVLSAGDEAKHTSVRKKFGQKVFSIDRGMWSLIDNNASAEHILSLHSSMGQSWQTSASRGAELDDELPWIFESRESGTTLVKQGSGSVASTEAIVVVPEGYEFHLHEDSDCERMGRVASHAREVFQVKGIVEFESPSDMSFKVRTGQASSSDEHFEWQGHREWGKFIHPDLAFRGMPRLCVARGEMAPQSVHGNISWRALGGTPIAHPLGPVEARFPSVGPVQLRSRMVVLPEEQSVEYEFGSALHGVIKFSNWGAAHANSATEGVFARSFCVDGVLIVELDSTSLLVPPERIDLDVFWPTTTASVRVQLPYPVKEVRAFDADGETVRSGSMFSVERLHGLRLLAIFGEGYSRVTLTFALKPMGNTKRVITHEIQPGWDVLRTEVRMQDYVEDILQLLTSSDETDAYVQVTLRASHDAEFELRVARYECHLEKDAFTIYLDAKGRGLADTETLRTLPVMAMRLDSNGEEPIALTPETTEGVPTGGWSFDPTIREPGVWLIYPAQDAAIKFRPTLWPVEGEINPLGRLAAAISISSPMARNHELDAVISVMAEDFQDSNWFDLERLASQLGHLPLQAIDLWVRLTHSSLGMAALALRFSGLQPAFIQRFGYELPFMWELVPYQAWYKAMSLLYKQCVEQLGEQTGKAVADMHLRGRIENLTNRHPALSYLLNIAQLEITGSTSRELDMFKNPQSLPVFNATLFDGENSFAQKLFRNQSVDRVWPEGFNRFVSMARSSPELVPLLSPQPASFRDSVVNLPIILAARVMASQSEDWQADPEHIYLLREIQTFDPDWFTEAYNFTVARAVSLGLIEH